MSRYFDDELIHSGVKGMKWRKHKYRAVRDKNGNPIYVYYTGTQKTAFENGQHVPKDKGDLPLNKLGFSRSGTKNEATGGGGQFQSRAYTQRQDRLITGAAKPIIPEERERLKRIDQSEKNAKQIRDRKRNKPIKEINKAIDNGKDVYSEHKLHKSETAKKLTATVGTAGKRTSKAIAGTFKYGSKYAMSSKDASPEKDYSEKASKERSKEYVARAKAERKKQNRKLSWHINRGKRFVEELFSKKKG